MGKLNKAMETKRPSAQFAQLQRKDWNHLKLCDSHKGKKVDLLVASFHFVEFYVEEAHPSMMSI